MQCSGVFQIGYRDRGTLFGEIAGEAGSAAKRAKTHDGHAAAFPGDWR